MAKNMNINMAMKVAIVAINKWLFLGWNYSLCPYTIKDATGKLQTKYIPDFLMQTKWTCNFDHMVSKWYKATQCNEPDAYLTKFYAYLDDENRQALITWVMNNYDGEKKIMNYTL